MPIVLQAPGCQIHDHNTYHVKRTCTSRPTYSKQSADTTQSKAPQVTQSAQSAIYTPFWTIALVTLHSSEKPTMLKAYSISGARSHWGMKDPNGRLKVRKKDYKQWRWLTSVHMVHANTNIAACNAATGQSISAKCTTTT